MEKNIKDYLHLYSGCDMETPDGVRKMLSYNNYFELIYVETQPVSISPSKAYCTYHVNACKPILRPWTDLKIEEVGDVLTWPTDCCFKKNRKGQIKYIDDKPLTFRAEEYRFLCSIGIDLFGLIESGLAIDKTKISQNQIS